jgi:hypothetical protein
MSKVAKSFCGLSNKILTFFSLSDSLSRNKILCSEFKEKKATSEPANKADKTSKETKTNPIQTRELRLMEGLTANKKILR